MDHVQHGDNVQHVDNVQHGENMQQVQNVGQVQSLGQRPKKPKSDPFWRYDLRICRYELWIIPVDLGPETEEIGSILRKSNFFTTGPETFGE